MLNWLPIRAKHSCYSYANCQSGSQGLVLAEDPRTTDSGCKLAWSGWNDALAMKAFLKGRQYPVHDCLELVVLFKMSTNNPGLKSVVLESSVKPSLDYQVSGSWIFCQHNTCMFWMHIVGSYGVCPVYIPFHLLFFCLLTEQDVTPYINTATINETHFLHHQNGHSLVLDPPLIVALWTAVNYC